MPSTGKTLVTRGAHSPGAERTISNKDVGTGGVVRQKRRDPLAGCPGKLRRLRQFTAAALCAAKQDQPDRVEHDLQILQLVDERNAPVFQRAVDDGIARGTGQEYHPIAEMGGTRH
jgi:hypothetical protein